MGLPLWKPKDIESDNDKEESFKHQQQLQQEAEDEESWSHRIVHDNVYNHHINNNNNNNNNTRRNNNSSRHTVNNNNNNNTHSNNRHLSPVSSSIPIVANSSSLRRSRIARRHSMLTSSLMDRRRSSRVHQLPGTSSSSPPVRSELDRRLQQRIHEKEDLLEQLQVTVSLLDQFLSARSALGSDLMTLPSFITEDLPAVLESAASLAAMAPTVLSSSLQQNHNMNEVTTLSEMVDRLLQIPPYSTRIHNVESNIITAHRRIREQLGLLGTTNIPLPIRPSNTIDAIDTRPSFINFLEAHSSSISRS